MSNGEDAANGTEPICFVVMGFHKKMAYDKDEKPRELDLDVLTEAHVGDFCEADAVQGGGDRLALRVEDLWFGRYVYPGAVVHVG